MNSVNKERLRQCIYAKLGILAFMTLAIAAFKGDDDKYFKFGPNEGLSVLSIKINTWYKYIGLNIFLALIEVINVISGEIAGPILGFNVYNPDKKIITEFNKNELQVMANAMWTTDDVVKALYIIITVSQVDISLLRVLYSSITSVYTVRTLLDEKTFEAEEYRVVEGVEMV